MTEPLRVHPRGSFPSVVFLPEILKTNPQSFLCLCSRQEKWRKGLLPESCLVWASENLDFSQAAITPVFCVNKYYLQVKMPGRNILKKRNSLTIGKEISKTTTSSPLSYNHPDPGAVPSQGRGGSYALFYGHLCVNICTNADSKLWMWNWEMMHGTCFYSQGKKKKKKVPLRERNYTLHSLCQRKWFT